VIQYHFSTLDFRVLIFTLMDTELRKKKILEIILKAHIETGEPVGSRYVSNILGLSSATIRNIMAILEEEGYIDQPHTSAGRLPTEMAYRDYANSLLNQMYGLGYEVDKINREVFSRYTTYTEIIENASSAISRLTNYTSFVIYPKDHIYMDGMYHLFEYQEFKTLKQAMRLLKVLDEKEKLLHLINEYLATGALNIRIGRENKVDGFEACTIIAASYTVRKKVVGGVGIIGPVRMKYRKVVPIVRHLADSFSRMLERVI